MGVFFRGVSGADVAAAAFSGAVASNAGDARTVEAGSTERLAFCGGGGFSRGPGGPSARLRLRVLSRSSAASMEAASGALRGGPPASVGSERPGPRPRARARGGEGAAGAGTSSLGPGGCTDVLLGVRFLPPGLGAAMRPRARAGRASRRATRAYSAPPGPSTLDAERSLSEDAGRAAGSSAGAEVLVGARDAAGTSASAAGASESRLSVASSWGTQYTGPSSVLSKDEKEALEDHDGEGCSSPEGGSRKLQLSVLSRS